MTQCTCAPPNENRRLRILRTLIYPAFLGAALFEFARTLTIITLQDFLCAWHWALTMAWFLAYFMMSYLMLLERPNKPFGWVAFAVNIIELCIVLAIALKLNHGNAPNPISGGLEYLVYFSWLLIPAVALLSNSMTHTDVKKSVSALAFVVALLGLGLTGMIEGLYIYILGAMYVVLVLYVIQVSVPSSATYLGGVARWLRDADKGA